MITTELVKRSADPGPGSPSFCSTHCPSSLQYFSRSPTPVRDRVRDRHSLPPVLSNGSLYSIAALAIVLPLFLPAAVAVIAGDAIAGEAQSGTLRYLLIRPVGRTRLLVAKLVAVLTFVLVAVVLVSGIGYITGTALLGDQPLTASTAVASVSGTELTPNQIAVRTVIAIGYVALSMLGVAAFALFLSTLTDSALSQASAPWGCSSDLRSC